MKQVIKGYVTYTKPRWEDDKPFGFSTYRPSAEYSPDTVILMEHSFEVEIPDEFDPRPAMVANLEEKKRNVRAEFARTVKEIDEQIQSLLAIEFDGTPKA